MTGIPFRRPPRARRRVAGYSLVEVVAAIALMAGALVPAVALVRDGIDLSVETDRRELLAIYAVSQLEERLGATTYGWSIGAAEGDYAAEGHPAIRYRTVSSDSPADGGLTGLLMDVRATVYYDDDGDDALDAGEMNCVYRTKVGKFATYDATAP